MPTTDTLYDQLQAAASGLPTVAPQVNLVVGTFNIQAHPNQWTSPLNIAGRVVFQSTAAAQQELVAAGGATPALAGPGRPHPPLPVRNPPRPRPVPYPTTVVGVLAVDVSLTFNLSDPTFSFSVVVNGQTTQGVGSITVNVGQANTVAWYISLDDPNAFIEHGVGGNLTIARPSGVGVFKVPVIPFGVVYEPPQPSGPHSATVNYSSGTTVGTTMTMSFSTGNSSTTPSASQFSSTTDAQSVMKDASTGLSAAAPVVALIPVVGAVVAAAFKIISQVLTTFSGLLGKSTASNTNVSVSTHTKTLQVAETFKNGFTSAAGAGPGQGDVIRYLIGSEMAWVFNNGALQLVPIGTPTACKNTVSDLQGMKNGSVPLIGDLKADQIDALLAIDPFVAGGADAALPQPRFSEVEPPQEFGSGIIPEFEWTYTTNEIDQQASTSSTTIAEQDTAGMFAFLGIGVTDTQNVSMTQTYTTSEARGKGTSVTTKVTFTNLPAGQHYAFQAFYDAVFGTFAFKSIDLTPSREVVGGTFTNKLGAPQANQAVKLHAGGRSFVSYTDATGRFSFRLPGIPTGPATLEVGRALESLNVGTTPSQVALKEPSMPL